MNNEWIKNLKVGDKVLVGYSGRYRQNTVATVDRITPSGLISVNGYLFKDGIKRGNKNMWLLRATDEAITKIEQGKKIMECFSLMDRTQKLSYNQAVAIIGILKGE